MPEGKGDRKNVISGVPTLGGPLGDFGRLTRSLEDESIFLEH